MNSISCPAILLAMNLLAATCPAHAAPMMIDGAMVISPARLMHAADAVRTGAPILRYAGTRKSRPRHRKPLISG